MKTWTRYKIGNRVIMVGEPEITSETIGDKIMVRIRQPVLRLSSREEKDIESQTARNGSYKNRNR